MVKRVEVWQADVEWPDDYTLVVLAADYDALEVDLEECKRTRGEWCQHAGNEQQRVVALEALLRKMRGELDAALALSEYPPLTLAPESPKGG